ncbi:MAG TPA: 50S ribosomal protein L35 [Halanaerobiales bacterium]|nr:50S ribosomal protein L35 [Halanaerobiales bacterium]
MPKLKTHKGIKKRVKVSKHGKIKRRKAFKSHILTKKSSKRKRHLRKPTTMDKTYQKRYKKLLPYE